MSEDNVATSVDHPSHDHPSSNHKKMSRTRLGATVAVGLASALLLAGCGGGGGAEPLTEEALVQRANDICTRHTDSIVSSTRSAFPGKEVPSADRLRDFAEQKVIPEVERQVEELEGLDAPEELSEDFNRYVDETNRAVEKVKKAPTSVFSQVDANDAFKEANAAAGRLKLTACAQGSDEWARAPALPAQ
jgi:hypothetical protein